MTTPPVLLSCLERYIGELSLRWAEHIDRADLPTYDRI